MEREQHELYEHASDRIRQKKRLYYHFILLLLGTFFLFVTNKWLSYKPDYDWWIWAATLWVFVFLFHFIKVFVMDGFMNKKWEREQIDKLIAKQSERIEQLKKRLKQFKKTMITLIAAAAENNALGKDNQLLWHLPDDFKRFKSITSGHHIIMGRKTFESFPKPLPNRTHVIITRQQYNAPTGCIVVNSLKEAIDACPKNEEIFIIGGGEIYNQSITIADKIDITRVHDTFEADTFFPEIDLTQWKLEFEEFHPKDEKHQYDFTFQTYHKK